jgi:hypothetical protein
VTLRSRLRSSEMAAARLTARLGWDDLSAMFRALCLGCVCVLPSGCGGEGSDSGGFTGAGGSTASGSTSSSPGGTSGGDSGEQGPGTTGEPTTGAGPEDSTGTTGEGSTTIGDGGSSGWFGTSTGGADTCKPNIDLVFVMDVSTSMSEFLSALAEEIVVVDQAIAALELDVAVRYGLVVFVDDVTSANGGAPYADVMQLQADFVEWSAFTQSNTQTDGMGGNVDFPENTLDALYTAAATFPWLPEEATLRMIIHTTDDSFGDKGADQSGEIVQHGYDETVLALQERQIRVFSFAAKLGGPDDADDVKAGFFTPYQDKTPIPTATDGGVFDLGDVYKKKISLSAAINQSVIDSLCAVYIPM